MARYDLVIKNIGVLATATGNSPKRGTCQGGVTIVKNAVIGINNGVIAYIGTESQDGEREFNAGRRLVTPGLVDSHTHLVFGGWRHHEMAKKLAGVAYLDILKQGGGILSTVDATRAATEDELFDKTKKLLSGIISHGTTSLEAKSGYGLDLDTEIKQLTVIKRLSRACGIDIAPTFLGAHAVPGEYADNRAGYIDFLCDTVLPAVRSQNLAVFCDIFCESSVFDKDESRRILEAAKSHGFKLKIHADEINAIGGSELAAELNAVSAEHLIEATDDGIASLANSGVIAVLLPATSLYLDKPFARARKMIESGVPVAIATDFNPGSSPNYNLQLPMNLSCIKYKLTPEETLTAVTLNAACAIGTGGKTGTLEIGKQADIAVWDCEDLNYLFYRYGNNQINTVIKKGELLNVSEYENQ